MISPTPLPTIVSTFGPDHETSDFKIGTDAKAMSKAIRGLIDTLYSNKVRAVIRELWANAYDAHIAAGNPHVPFDCQLPNWMSPNFVVRDYGISLSHEDVMELYVTIFGSSKDESNDFTGQWGLGSKVFFALTDHAQITAWKDGECRVYLAEMTETGVPQIMHLSTVPSDEPDGLEVSFAVEKSRWDEFEIEAKSVAFGFPTTPNVEGVELPKLEVTFGEDNWSVYEGNYAVRQGVVIYPVLNHQVGYKLPDILKNGSGIIVDVPMGSVEVTLSREALSFNDETRAKVMGFFNKATEDLTAFIQGKIDEADNMLGAELIRHAWKKHLNQMPELTFKGRKLTGIITFEKDREVPVLTTLSNGEEVKPRFDIHNLDKLLLIIDRDEKLVRRRLRVREYGKKGRKGLPTYVLHNPSARVLSQLMRRLGLRRDQFMSIVDVYDPGPTSSSSWGASTAIDGSAKRSGLYTVHGADLYRIATDELPEDYVWFPIDKTAPSTGVEFHFKGMDYSTRIDELTTIKNLVTILGVDRQLVLFTPSAVKRIQPEDEDKVDAVLQEAADAVYEEVLEYCRVSAIYNEFDSSLGSYIEEACGEKPVAKSAFYAHWLVYHFYPDLTEDREAAEELGQEVAQELREKFPLVFDDKPDSQAVLTYINNIKKESVTS